LSTGIAGYCARAASDHVAAVPPSIVMNSRLPLVSEFKRLRTVPLHVNDGHKRIWQNALYGGVGFQILQPAHLLVPFTGERGGRAPRTALRDQGGYQLF
jgi:hypothetical protein